MAPSTVHFTAIAVAHVNLPPLEAISEQFAERLAPRRSREIRERRCLGDASGERLRTSTAIGFLISIVDDRVASDAESLSLFGRKTSRQDVSVDFTQVDRHHELGIGALQVVAANGFLDEFFSVLIQVLHGIHPFCRRTFSISFAMEWKSASLH